MIKIKIFQSAFTHKNVGNTSIPVADYYYCVYLLGVLIHSVTITGIEKGSEKQIFGNRNILKR